MTKSQSHTKWITLIAAIGGRVLRQGFCQWQQQALARTVHNTTKGGLPAVTQSSIPTLSQALANSKRGPISILVFPLLKNQTILSAKKCTLLQIKMNTYKIQTY